MSGYYGPGSMVGSGIFSTSSDREVEYGGLRDLLLPGDEVLTVDCEFTGEVEVHWDDRSRAGLWVCPECTTEHVVDTDDDFDGD